VSVHKVIIASDVHFGAESRDSLISFWRFLVDTKPSLLVLAGDIVDLQAISKYDPEDDSPHEVISEIKQAVTFINATVRQQKIPVYILSGNHEDRWKKAIVGSRAVALRGAKGLTLHEQFTAQGMDQSVRWVDEKPGVPGLFVGKRAILIRHGHVQSGKYSSAKSVPDKLLRQTPTVSTLVGHHHRGGFLAQTILGQTVYGIANPHLSSDHAYNPNANWQRGFTLLEFYGASRLRDCVKFTPHVILLDSDNSFCYGGKVYNSKRE